MPLNDIPPCLIHINKEGKWFHKGFEMIHREFIRLFYEHMELDSMGRYIINYRDERCYVEVEDTAFVVNRVELDDQADHSRFVLYLSDDSQEGLLPDTLYVGKDNVLYCRVKDRTFPARFSRAAYYQLAEYFEETGGDYYLPLNEERYIIRENKE